ncbi:MAG: S8/S53 family peptidase [Candidatus Omnitrophota bacterium]
MIKISIVGLGLIGGSIGLALKSTARRSYFISGFTRSQGNAQIALKRGAIDTVETDYGRLLKITLANGDTEVYTYYGTNSIMETKTVTTGSDTIIYTYRDDASNLLWKKQMVDGTVYEYRNERFYNFDDGDMMNDYGRLLKETKPNGDTESYMYYGSISNVKTKTVTEITTGNVTVYTYYNDSNGRMAIKILPDGTVYKHYNESFFDNNTPLKSEDDYGRMYQVVTTDGKTLTYEAYYEGTDLTAKMSEISNYSGDLYFFYNDYTINYADDLNNEIGFRKEDSNGDIYEFKLRNGVYHLYKKVWAAGNRTFWYFWDGLEELNKLGLGVMVEPPTSWSYEIWVGYPFNRNSPDPTNPEVGWYGSFPVENPDDKPELGAWPPSNVDYPTAGGPLSLVLDQGVEFIEAENKAPVINMSSFLENVEKLKSKTEGAGVIVALLDTGEEGHGLETASVIRSEASEVDIMSLKVFDEGSTSSKIIAEAIRYAVDNSADVLCLPFSLLPVNDPVEDAINYALDKGVILIAAAGNDGSEILKNSLAAQNGIITIGSADNDGKISAWSNYGSELDLFAPWDVITLDNSENKAGTSFSAAFVTGLTALILSENPGMTREDVLLGLKNILTPFNAEDMLYQDYCSLLLLGEIVPVASNENSVNGDEMVSKCEMQNKKKEQFNGHSMVVDICAYEKSYNEYKNMV